MPQLSLLPSEPPPRAPQACLTCKKQKRKCDKALPSCTRCASLQRACDYESDTGTTSSTAAAAPTAQDFASLQRKLAQIEARLENLPRTTHVDPSLGMNVDTAMDIDDGGKSMGRGVETATATLPTNRFPSSLFLDIDMYHFAKNIPPRPTVDIPMEVLEILASSDVIEQTATIYFNTIHAWFCFISRKRMSLGLSLTDGGPDLAMLFLAMKLVTTPPAYPPAGASPADNASSSSPSLPAQTTLYAASKRFLALLEAAGTASLLHLQAMTLVALYEYGHAIYPAAWMSVGHCVRYAAMLGLPSHASSVLGPCTTWTEVEERRRVWWAIHILDRAISLGSKRPFAGSPGLPSSKDVFLPMDDAAWDAGDMGRASPHPLTTPMDSNVSLSPFARLAQASLLVTKAMAHCRQAVGRYNEHHDRIQQRRHRRKRSKSRSHTGHPDGSTSDSLHHCGDNDPLPRISNRDDARRRHSPGGGSTTTTKPYDVKEVTALISEQNALCKAITRDLAHSSSSSPNATSTSTSTPTAAAAAPLSSLATGTDKHTDISRTNTTTMDLYWAYLPARCLIWSTSVMVLDMYACPEHMRPENSYSAPSVMTMGGTATPPSSFPSSSSPPSQEQNGDGTHDEMDEDGDDDDDNGKSEDREDEGREETEADSTAEMELAMQTEAINGLKTAGTRVREISTELLSSFTSPSLQPSPSHNSTASVPAPPLLPLSVPPLPLQHTLGKVSPLCLDVLYCGVSTFQWLWRESGDPEMRAGLDVMRTCMEYLDARWRLSGRYLEMARSYNFVPTQ